jgi:hypothetical protein
MFHCGHFVASRCFAIVLREDNVAPQCANCNLHDKDASQHYKTWMLWVRGRHVIDRLYRLKRTTRQFTTEELVDLQIAYQARLDAAIKRMEG